MTAANRYSFRKATVDDLPLLTAWQSNPHVRAWWGSDESYDAADLADPRVARWIVSTAERPLCVHAGLYRPRLGRSPFC
ncbi:GNAT family N-acetyltransferase (plasmid) [Sinorhizobium meliloti]|nr:GNAT family N-acetyltransferase [Sinorhizobium meliloti]